MRRSPSSSPPRHAQRDAVERHQSRVDQDRLLSRHFQMAVAKAENVTRRQQHWAELIRAPVLRGQVIAAPDTLIPAQAEQIGQGAALGLAGAAQRHPLDGKIFWKFVFGFQPSQWQRLGVDDLHPQFQLLAAKQALRLELAGIADGREAIPPPQGRGARHQQQQHIQQQQQRAAHKYRNHEQK